MRRLLTMIALTALTFGCVQRNEAPNPQAELELTYVSGHLGSYVDCPEESMRLNPARVASDPAAIQGAPAAGDCADEDCGGGPLNCTSAEITIRVTNAGDEALDEISVTALMLLTTENDLLGNPGVERVSVAGEDFDGALDAGETLDLLIEFTGPHPQDLGWNEGALIEVHVGDGASDDTEITSPEVQALAAFAT